MAIKPDTEKSASTEPPLKALSQLQEAGLGNMFAMSTAWVEAFSDMGAEVIGFMAERIKEDVQTQHEILHCKSATELQHIQAQFVQKAIDQYQAETGKLVEMSSKVFDQKPDDTTS